MLLSIWGVRSKVSDCVGCVCWGSFVTLSLCHSVGRRRPYQCKDLLSSSHKPPRTQVHSRDTAQQLRSQVLQPFLAGLAINEGVWSQSGDLPVANGTNHILSLLEGVARGNGELVVSVLLDRVAPHLPSDAAPWLPGEGPRSTSLEWYLTL